METILNCSHLLVGKEILKFSILISELHISNYTMNVKQIMIAFFFLLLKKVKIICRKFPVLHITFYCQVSAVAFFILVKNVLHMPVYKSK